MRVQGNLMVGVQAKEEVDGGQLLRGMWMNMWKADPLVWDNSEDVWNYSLRAFNIKSVFEYL